MSSGKRGVVATRRTIAIVVLCAVAMSLSYAQSAPPLSADPPISCTDCEAWNAPQEPFRVFGNTYYVGVRGLSAVLIDAGGSLILLDAALPQSAPLIDANIRKLGFRSENIALIATSHEHFDHVGGVAAFQRLSGATVVTSRPGSEALQTGAPTPQDPQSGVKPPLFPVVNNLRVVKDGEIVQVASVQLTAHLTPGHTPGSTSWSWRSCEGERCLNVVYADSLNAVSSDEFRFSGNGNRPSIVEEFRRSIGKIESLPCDIILSVHPGFTGMAQKLKIRSTGGTPDPFVDPEGCPSYAADMRRRLDARVAEETKR